MTKILLVEDDKSLREIYGVRLFAEGYDVVSAGDGEEALAVAIKERPVLIITDVMMPKISGFDMLDILRSTTETKDIKVIVMTALGSEDNKDRGERLGADRYLVKSQVGIEDVVRVVHELLGDQPPARPAGQPAASPTGMVAPMGAPAAAGAAVPPPPAMPSAPGGVPPSLPPRPAAPTVRPTPPAANRPGMISSPGLAAPGMPANQQQPAPTPAAQSFTPPPQQPQNDNTNDTPTRRTKVIQPIGDPSQKVDIQALVDKELAKEGGAPAVSADQERQIVAGQVDNFASQPAPPPATAAPAIPPAEPSQLPQFNPQPPVNPPPAPPAPPQAPSQTPPPMSPSANGNAPQAQ